MIRASAAHAMGSCATESPASRPGVSRAPLAASPIPASAGRAARIGHLPADMTAWYGRRMAQREQPWLMRTYAGHTNPHAANELYRTNLAKGQTGLSVAFDLPTQTGYDSDDPMAAGEVGKVGVPISPHRRHAGALRRAFRWRR